MIPSVRCPPGYRWLRAGREFGLVREDLAELPLATWWQTAAPLAGVRGRGGVECLGLESGLVAVLRTYRRGGVFASLFGMTYFDCGRAFRELAVLAQLHRHGVAVVVPLAALRRRRGCGFGYRLATEWLTDAQPLPQFLAAAAESRAEVVRGAGRVVGAAFAAGLWHPDLHVDNLVARRRPDGVEVRLLDLDRARLLPQLGQRRRDRMLLRMARYLASHAAELPVVVGRSDQLRFLAGCGFDRAARRGLLARLAPDYARALRRYRRRSSRNQGRRMDYCPRPPVADSRIEDSR